MVRAASPIQVLATRFEQCEFEGKWLAAVGRPELSGTWFVYGPPKNGKTSFSLMLTKYLTRFGRVAYNSIEEGISLSLKQAIEREGMADVSGRWVLLDKESIADLIIRLKRNKSPDVIVIDSIQFADMSWANYKKLKAEFPRKLFIYISHVDGRVPDGRAARRIWRDANVAFEICHFKALPTSRYGGKKEPIVISEERANEWWGE